MHIFAETKRLLALGVALLFFNSIGLGQNYSLITFGVGSSPNYYNNSYANVIEGDTFLDIVVSRKGTTNTTVSVHYATEVQEQTAVPGVDFVPLDGTLEFFPGEILKTLRLTFIDNAIVNHTRQLSVYLDSASGGAVLGNPSRFYVGIYDNESPNLVDGTFDPGTALLSYNESFGTANKVALQPDGKILVAGDFNTVDDNLRKGLVRLSRNGAYDTNFNEGPGVDGEVFDLNLQGDGKIIAVGRFESVNGFACSNLVRFTSVGSVDTSFTAYTEADGTVRSIRRQSTGQYVIAGDFKRVNGVVRNGLARLEADGNLDMIFQPSIGADSSISTILVLPDDSVLVAGYYTKMVTNAIYGYSYQTADCWLKKLTPQGMLDGTFNQGSLTSPNNSSDSRIRALAVQADGKILVGGQFSMVNGYAGNNLIRFYPDGTWDSGFRYSGWTGIMDMIALPDGKILLGSSYATYYPYYGSYDSYYNAYSYYYAGSGSVVRINSDGTVDTAFPPGAYADGSVRSLAVEPDNKILIGGSFQTVDQISRVGIARISVDANDNNRLDFTKNRFLVTEDATNVVVSVRRSGNSSQRRTVQLVAVPDTAQPNVHYVPVLNEVIFEPLETIKTITIPILNNNTIERDPIFRVVLTNATGGAAIGMQSVAQVFIENDERPQLVDAGFNPGTGANRKVYDMVIQPDGKVVIGGQFRAINNFRRNHVARLNRDGSVDLGFNTGLGPDGYVRAVARQADGKIFIGGEFNKVNATTCPRLARLNEDGSLDTTFSSTISWGIIYSVLIEPDGKVWAGGSMGMNTANNFQLARFHTNGAVDRTIPGYWTETLAIQPDGKLLVGVGYGWAGEAGLKRYLPDHTWDAGFQANQYLTNYPLIQSIAVQPDGKIVIGGSFNMVGRKQRNIARLNADGSLDESFKVGTGANNTVNTIALQSDGKIVLGGEFFTINNQASRRMARLNADGTLDDTLLPGKGANDEIHVIQVQSDGQILLGGEFSALNGINVDHIARIHGSPVSGVSLDFVDAHRTVGESSGNVELTLRRYGPSDNSLTVAFTTQDLSATGNRDYATQSGQLVFNPMEVTKNISIPVMQDGLVEGDELFYVVLTNQVGDAVFGLNSKATVNILDDQQPACLNPEFKLSKQIAGEVDALVVQPDNKILAGGLFAWSFMPYNEYYYYYYGYYYYGNSSLVNLARFNPDGSVDTGFQPPIPNGTVRAITLQSDDKILVGGAFTLMGSNAVFNLARLHTNGTLDSGFNAQLSDQVRAIALQPDGKIVVGGNFNFYFGSTNQKSIARLETNGALDATFVAGSGANDRVRAVLVQPDGRILLAGRFSKVNGIKRAGVARLMNNGNLDDSFDPGVGPNNEVRAMALQADGKVLIGGEFDTVAGEIRFYLARLNGNGSLDRTFQPEPITHSTSSVVPLVNSIELLNDGKIAIAGNFNRIGDARWLRLARFNPDGSLDRGFNPGNTLPDSYYSYWYWNYYYYQDSSGDYQPGAITALTLNNNGDILAGSQSSQIYSFLSNSVGSQVQLTGGSILSLSEHGGDNMVGISRLGDVSQPLDLSLRLIGGTATANEDFSMADSDIHFAPMQTEAGMRLSVRNDVQAERDETIEIAMDTPTGNVRAALATNQLIIIRDDDRPGTEDTGFAPYLIHDSFYYSYYYQTPELRRLALADTGKILVAGAFELANGYLKRNLALLRSDGTTEPNFTGALGSVYVEAVIAQTNRTWLTIQNARINRLLEHGEEDPTFQPIGVGYYTAKLLASRFGGRIYVWDRTPGSAYTNNYPSVTLKRYHSNGALEAQYPPRIFFPEPSNMIETADGRLWVFQSDAIQCLSPDGASVETFGRGGFSEPNYYTSRKCIEQPDGKVVVAGSFVFTTSLSVGPRYGLVRFNTNGSLDTTFNTPLTNGVRIDHLLAQSDGKLIVVGNFNEIQGVQRNHVARLHSDGRLDLSFDPGGGFDASYYSSTVMDALLDDQGRLVMCGSFTRFSGFDCQGLVRLNTDRPVHVAPVTAAALSGFGLRVDALPGHVYQIQQSLNLRDWHNISTNTANDYYFDFRDPDVLGPMKYYRVLRP